MIYHETVVGPAAKFHHALLLVKREELDIDAAVRFVNCRRVPAYLSVVMENSLGHNSYFVVAVSANKNGSFFIITVSIEMIHRETHCGFSA